MRNQVINGDLIINRLFVQEDVKRYDKQEKNDAEKIDTVTDSTINGFQQTLSVKII